MNDILQGIAVGIILIFAIVWIIRRIRRKPDCNCGCEGCPAAKKCEKNK